MPFIRTKNYAKIAAENLLELQNRHRELVTSHRDARKLKMRQRQSSSKPSQKYDIMQPSGTNDNNKIATMFEFYKRYLKQELVLEKEQNLLREYMDTYVKGYKLILRLYLLKNKGYDLKQLESETLDFKSMTIYTHMLNEYVEKMYLFLEEFKECINNLNKNWSKKVVVL